MNNLRGKLGQETPNSIANKKQKLMPENWKTYKLEDLVTKLGDGIHGTPKYSEDGEYHFINGNNLIDGKIIIKPETKRVTKAEYLKHKRELNERTLLVSINGTIGKTAYYQGEKVMLGKSACYFNVKEGVNIKFIKQVISSKYFLDYLESNYTGSVIKNVSLKSMRELPINLPPLQEQKSIASILSALDDKIELNLQMNKTLEEMAMALYKHWFVDFGPFQDGEFVDSELGEIPKGWEVKMLDEILQFKNQGVNTTTEKVKYSDDGIPVIRANNISSNKIDISNLVYVDEKTFTRVRSQCKPSYGDILYTNIGSQLGNASLSYMNFEYLIAWNVLRIKVDENIYAPELLVTFFNNPKKREELMNLNSSSTMPFVSGSVLGKIQVIVPDKGNLDLISKELKNLYSLKNANHKENETLTQLRDTLLPKLISGEVRVKEVEKIVSEAL